MQANINEVKAGSVFYSLTLTGNYSFVQTSVGRRMVVEAKCICGNIKNYPLRFLKTGNTKSCGCVRKEKLIASKITHNLSKHPLYSVYQDMNRRCYDDKCEAYKNYGGRGITVCEEWKESVKTFVDWGMENGYKKGLELDRERVNGNYEPTNCRFVTRAINNSNTRRVIRVTAFGKTKTVADWTRDGRCSISEKALAARVRSGKWGIEDAITFGANENVVLNRFKSTSVILNAFGEEKSMVEWSRDERSKVGYSGLKKRLKQGWSIEKAISFPKQ